MNPFSNKTQNPFKVPEGKVSLDEYRANPDRVGTEEGARVSRLPIMAAIGDPDTDLTSLDSVAEKARNYRSQLAQQGEAPLRVRAAFNREQAEVDALGEIYGDEENFDEGMRNGALAALQASFSTSDRAFEDYSRSVALEAEYADGLEAWNALEEDYTPQNYLTGVDALVRDQRIRANAVANRAILSNYADEVSLIREERPWWRGLIEMAAIQSLPLYSSSRQSGVLNEDASWLDNLFAGESMRSDRAEVIRMMERMPPEEFAQFAEQLNEEIRDRTTTFLSAGTTDRSLQEEMLRRISGTGSTQGLNVINAIDNVPVLQVATSLTTRSVRMGRNIMSDTIQSGSRNKAIERLAEVDLSMSAPGAGFVDEATGNVMIESLNRAGLESTDDFVASVSHSALNPFGDITPAPVAGGVAQRVAESRAMFDTLLEQGDGPLIQASTGINVADEALTAAANKRLQAIIPNRPLQNVTTETVDYTNGSASVKAVAEFGRVDGAGFASEAAATRQASRLGLADDSVEIFSGAENGVDGPWFIRVRTDVPLTGIYKTPMENNSGGATSRFLASGRESTDTLLQDAGIVGGQTRDRILRDIVRPLQESFTRLNGEERTTIDAIWGLGDRQARWFDDREFQVLYERQTGRPPTDRARQAYRDAIRLNDIEYMLKNDEVTRTMRNRGFENFMIDSENLTLAPGRGREIAGANVRGNTRVYDSETGQLRRLDEAEIGDNKVLIEFQEQFTAPGELTTRYLLAPRRSIRRSELGEYNVPYRPGGRRYYNTPYYVKQSRVRINGDGSEFLERPRTFITGRTAKEVREWAESMNLARLAVREMGSIDGSEARRIFAQTLDEILEGTGTTGARFLDDVDAGKIDLDNAFEVVLDGELPTAYRNNNSPWGADDFDDAADFAAQTDVLRQARKGEDPLTDYRGNQAPVLDMFQSLNRSIMSISRSAGFGNYKEEMINRWVSTYGAHLAPLRNGATPMEIFRDGRLVDTADSRIASSAEANRAIIQRTLNWVTPEQRTWNTFQRQVTDRMAEIGGVKIANKTSNWLSNNNPVSAMRQAAFDMKLGMFNIAQFPLQVSHLGAIMALRPKDAGGIFVNTGPLAAAMRQTNEAFGNTVEMFIRRGLHKSAGMTADEYRAFTSMLRRSGYTRIGDNQVLNGGQTVDVVWSSGARTRQRFREWGRVWFNQAETWNRIGASMAAWKEIVQEGGMSMSDPATLNRVLGRADDYAFNMTRESSSWWQNGLASVPTQFWSYSARMIEAMVGKKFTAQQKLQLLGFQSVVYGGYGIPLGGLAVYLADKGGDLVGIDPEPQATAPALNTFRGFANRGLLDHAVKWASGADVQVSSRIGVGGFATQLARDLFNDGQYGPVSTVDFLGGATLSIWADTGEELVDIFKIGLALHGSNPPPEAVTRDALYRVAGNLSSVSNGLKAFYLFHHGMALNTDLQMQFDSEDLRGDWVTSLAQALSYAPIEQRERQQAFEYMSWDKAKTEELAGVINNYIQRMYATESDLDEMGVDIALLMGPLDPYTRREVLEQIDFQQDRLEELVNRAVHMKNEREIGRQLEAEREN